MKYCYLILALTLLICCDIPSADTAEFAYIEVDKLTLSDSDISFPDVWYFQDGQTKGVFELPRRIPVVSDKPFVGVFQAGIRENGINSLPRTYPFVNTLEVSLDLEDSEVVSINPVVNYLAETKIRLDADFTSENIFGYDEDGVDSVRIVTTSFDTGIIELKGGERLEEATRLVYNDIPSDGSPVYIEVEYRGDLDLEVGIIGVSGSEVFKEYFVSLRSENEWKKSYINVTDLIIASNLPGYQVLLGADNSQDNMEASIEVDNIKLLHF